MRPVMRDGHVFGADQARAQDKKQIDAVAVKTGHPIIPAARAGERVQKLVPIAKEDVKQAPEKGQIDDE